MARFFLRGDYLLTKSRAQKDMILKFKIYGNQDSKLGNAIPALRMTQRGKWSDKAQRYLMWKEYVREQYWWGVEGKRLLSVPFTGQQCAGLDIFIWWANRAHGDAENVFKGIADALFVNDKYLMGSFYFGYDKSKPRVEVTIETDLSTVAG